MKFLARNYENTSLDYRFIRAIVKKDVIHLVDPCDP